jgi:hypothetical protein
MSNPEDSTTPAPQNDAENGDDDPVGACQFTNASGQLVCIDNMKKSECAQILNSIFIEGGSCD